MILQLQHRGEALTVDVEEDVDRLDAFSFASDPTIGSLHRLDGKVLAGRLLDDRSGEALQPGRLFELRSPRLRGTFRLMSSDGRFRSEGVYTFATPEAA